MLRQLIEQDASGRVELAVTPEEADLILVVGIYEKHAFLNLRKHAGWRRFPSKSFGYYEGDNPPALLHGVYSSATRCKGLWGRMQSSAYPVTAVWRPNPQPPWDPAQPRPKRWLFSFCGRRSHAIRKRLFALRFPPDEVLMEDTTERYDRFLGARERSGENPQERCWDTLADSKFALCPRGAGAATVRVYEAMGIGVAPVIISDGWLRPQGPRWDDFALFVPEPRCGSVYELVKAHEAEWRERGRLAAAAYREFFSPEVVLHHILDSLETIRQTQRLPETWAARLSPVITVLEWGYQTRHGVESGFKGLAKRVWRGLAGLKPGFLSC